MAFEYQPPTGPLSGDSFEDQTEDFFSRLRLDIDNNTNAIDAVQRSQAQLESAVENQIAIFESDLEDVAERIDGAISTATNALTVAQNAQNTADSFATQINSAILSAAAAQDSALAAQNSANLAGQRATEAVNAAQDAQQAAANAVQTSGDQIIAGTKTFSQSPVVPTVTAGDNSTKAASTAYVDNAVSSVGGDFVHLSGSETITGAKTFTSTITASGGVTGNVSGNCSGSSGSCTGNAATATKLQTARTISLTGDVTGSASFDGSGNITIYTTVSSTGVPVGTIIFTGRTSAPSGYLICNGSAISRSTYSALYSAIGTSYGSGNGSSTFNIPNLIGKFIEGNSTVGQSGGEATHTLTVDEMPAHTHSFSKNVRTSSGTVYFGGSGGNMGSLSGTESAGGGQAHNNLPPYLTALPCIKY